MINKSMYILGATLCVVLATVTTVAFTIGIVKIILELSPFLGVCMAVIIVSVIIGTVMIMYALITNNLED